MTEKQDTLENFDSITGRRLNPLNDFLFLKTMGEKGDEEQLLGFINAVLRRTGRQELASIEIVEARDITPEILGDKASVLDVLGRTGAGDIIEVEVQLRNLGNMDRRSLFYWSRKYAGDLKSGEDYRILPGVIAINIIDFELYPTEGFHACFHLWEDTEKNILMSDALEIHFIDMVKFGRRRDTDTRAAEGGEKRGSPLGDPLYRWLVYFDKDSPAGLVKEALTMDSAIQKVHEKAALVTRDKESMRVYQMREKALSDWTSGVNHARREGHAEGRQEGRLEGRQEGRAIGKQEGAQELLNLLTQGKTIEEAKRILNLE